MSWRWLLLVALVSASASAQQRDTRATPAGAAEISGAVLSPEPNPQPIRRAVVSITGGDLISPRSVITDDDGRFVFGRLAAGSYSVVARKAAYIAAEFGSMRPARPGSRITMAAGERRAISITMFRGAAVGGTLRDGNGAPLPGVNVVAMDARAAAGAAPVLPTGSTTTDDRGRFRIFGLVPGEFVLMASPVPDGTGEIGAATASDVDALIAALTQRQTGAGATSAAAAAKPEPLAPPASVGFAPSFFPGTAMFADAQRLRLEPGDDRDGLTFTVTHVPVASIEGTVTGGVADLSAVQLAIIPDGPRLSGVFGTLAITSRPPDASGAFAYGNLSPGRYRIVARARAGAAPPPGSLGTPVVAGRGGGAGGGAPPPGVLPSSGDMLYAVADVEVRGQDVRGLSLALRPGGTIAGRVVFDAAAAPLPDDFTAFRIQAAMLGGSYVSQSGGTRVGTALSGIPAVSLNEDGTFLIAGIGPAQYTLNVMMPPGAANIWKQRTAIVGGRDLFDDILDGPDIALREVVVTISDRRTEIAGSLQSASGQPASEYYVVAFSTTPAHWRTGARRSQSARPDTSGRYVFSDLPAGEYFIAALTDLDPAEWMEPHFLEQVAPAGIRVRIGEGEKKVQDLRIK